MKQFLNLSCSTLSYFSRKNVTSYLGCRLDTADEALHMFAFWCLPNGQVPAGPTTRAQFHLFPALQTVAHSTRANCRTKKHSILELILSIIIMRAIEKLQITKATKKQKQKKNTFEKQ